MLANANVAIGYLKQKIREKNAIENTRLNKKNFDNNKLLLDEIKILREDNQFLRTIKIDLEKKIEYIKKSWADSNGKKYFKPPVSFLRKPSNHKFFICANCGGEKKARRVRIVSDNKNFTICRACFDFVDYNFNVKKWGID